MLGEFEYLVLSTAASLGDEAYGASIRGEMEQVSQRACSIGALYTTIDRLEKKGLLKTWMGGTTAQRGGRARRMVQITPTGALEAKEFYNAMTRASRRAPWALEAEKGQP